MSSHHGTEFSMLKASSTTDSASPYIAQLAAVFLYRPNVISHSHNFVHFTIN